MGVTLRKQGRKYRCFIHHDNRRTSEVFPTKETAKVFADEMRLALARRDFTLPDPTAAPGATLAACATAWLADVQALGLIRPSSAENYQRVLDNYILPSFGPRAIASPTAPEIRQFCIRLRTDGAVRWKAKKPRPLKASTLALVLGPLRQSCEKAVRDGLIVANPVGGVGRIQARRGVVTAQPDPFSGEELAAILAGARRLGDDIAVWIELWARTGIRRGELSGASAAGHGRSARDGPRSTYLEPGPDRFDEDWSGAAGLHDAPIAPWLRVDSPGPEGPRDIRVSARGVGEPRGALPALRNLDRSGRGHRPRRRPRGGGCGRRSGHSRRTSRAPNDPLPTRHIRIT